MNRSKKKIAPLLLAAAALAALAIAGSSERFDALADKSRQAKTASYYDNHNGGYQASAARRIREVFY